MVRKDLSVFILHIEWSEVWWRFKVHRGIRGGFEFLFLIKDHEESLWKDIQKGSRYLGLSRWGNPNF